MKNYRIFVEKRPGFRVEAESLQHDLNENLGLHLSQLRLLNVYDLFGFTPELLEASRYRVFGEVQTDEVTDACDLEGRKFLAVEYLPGQFDQRAASAVDCVRLIDPEAEVRIRSSRLLLLDAATTDEELARVRKYYINAVESREKDLSVLSDMEQAEVKPVEVLAGLRELTDGELAPYCAKMGLAMNAVPIMMAMPAGMSMRLVFRMSFKVMDHMVDSVPFFECFYSAFSGNVSRKPHSLWRPHVPSSAVHSSGLLSACFRPPRSGRRRTRAHGRRKTRRPHHA